MSAVVIADPTGDVYGIPTYPWRMAPAGLATRRQLSAAGLRPGGQDVAAQILRPRRRRGPLVGYLYRVELAKPKRALTPAMRAAITAAVTARQHCHECRHHVGYIPPAYTGRRCLDCADHPTPTIHKGDTL